MEKMWIIRLIIFVGLVSCSRSSDSSKTENNQEKNDPDMLTEDNGTSHLLMSDTLFDGLAKSDHPMPLLSLYEDYFISINFDDICLHFKTYTVPEKQNLIFSFSKLYVKTYMTGYEDEGIALNIVNDINVGRNTFAFYKILIEEFLGEKYFIKDSQIILKSTNKSAEALTGGELLSAINKKYQKNGDFRINKIINPEK